ncbi:cyclin-like protein [Diplogelasinospora grovesii]|uniref:Cyclin-like protein n=1 Tax=Diplogelasinospora grovesii TaxID=303347 RepID=A0AAN6S1F0_9PEZI|nr:cyclin-like protein [Diplogelasinospora grovesii]
MAHMTNPLATPDQLCALRHSPNSLPSELADLVFFQTQCLTQAAGLLLQLPQSVTAQANVILARYWLVEGLMSYEFSDVSAATIFLVSKVSSSPRRPRDVCNVYAYLLSPSSTFLRPPSSPPPVNNPKDYYLSESAFHRFHSRILNLESRILYALGFDTHVSLPHPLAITYLQALDFLGTPKQRISQSVLRYLNTALLSPQMLYLTSQPNALAVAAIYSAAKDTGAKMPESEWWEVFDVDREELGFLVVGMRSVQGYMDKLREEIPVDGRGKRGLLWRKDVQQEMARRGLEISIPNNNNNSTKSGDAEDEMMRLMDEKVARMEEYD